MYKTRLLLCSQGHVLLFLLSSGVAMKPGSNPTLDYIIWGVGKPLLARGMILKVHFPFLY